ncbi:MAG: AAA domain-containing protein [Clostridiaceae bacterium]
MALTFNVIKRLRPKSDTSDIILVEDKTTKRKFVIKRIYGLNNSLYRSIFEKEIGALKKLRHSENIVELLGNSISKTVDDTYIGNIFIEYIDGKTLQKSISSLIRVPDKYRIIKQLLEAIRFAHENGIIHRDINPDNIMVTDDLSVKLIDFGTCKIKGMIQKSTTYQWATNKYAAPEVRYHSSNATEKSDIYSIGAIIYYIFTKKEPPMPEDFCKEITNASGMDPNLKEILQKMTQLRPDDRYDNAVDLEIAFSALFQKYLSNNELYYLTVSYEQVESLKRQHLVQSTKLFQQLLTEDIPSNFTNAYASYRVENEINYFIFDGINFSMECIFNAEQDSFNVIKFTKLFSYIREQHKDRFMSVPGNFLFQRSFEQITSTNNSYELSNRIIDHVVNILSKKNIDNEYNKKFGFWFDFIKVMIEETQNRALKLNYSEFKEENGLIYFTIKSASNVDINDEIIKGIKLIQVKKNHNGKEKRYEIGTVEELDYDENILVIKPSPNLNKKSISPSGEIWVDYWEQVAQYYRQMRALIEFQRDEISSNGNIKAVFSGLKEPDFFRVIPKVNYYDKNLDDSQKSAVNKALSSKDIMIIQGPPGTGKTSVIIEVLRQLLAYNKRHRIDEQKILIVSQSHSAVDKILEDLDPYIKDDNVIRIGEEKNLSDLAKKYSIDNKKITWIENIIERSKEQLDLLRQSLGVSAKDCIEFIKAHELLVISNSSEEDINTAKEYMEGFYSKYKLNSDNIQIKKMLVCFNWIKHLEETNEIEEYFIKNATITVGTCSGFSSNPFVSKTVFDYVIVDEAAKATFPEIIVSLIKANKVILVGDHKQLPPVFDQDALNKSEKNVDIEILKHGGFEKLYSIMSEQCKETLNTQYRMHPCIGNLISRVFYDQAIQNGISIEERDLDLSTYKGIPIMWISTSNYQEKIRFHQTPHINSGNKSYSNYLEIKLIIEQLKIINNEMPYGLYSVGIITPYRAQLNKIQREINTLELNNLSIEVNTVDAFQGSEKDIILYSTVRSSSIPNIGFLKEKERLNVSFSRAKRLLIIVGDMNFLNNTSIKENRFPQIIQFICQNKECKIIEKEQ